VIGATSEHLEIFPEIGPALQGRPADEDERVLEGFLVFDAVGIPNPGGDTTGREMVVYKFLPKASNDYDLRWRVAVAPLHEEFTPLMAGRQSVSRPEQVDSAYLPIIPGEDADSGALIERQRKSRICAR
jgi:hypothetical protein